MPKPPLFGNQKEGAGFRVQRFTVQRFSGWNHSATILTPES